MRRGYPKKAANGCSFTRSGKELMARVKKELTQLTPQLMGYVEKCSINTTIEAELFDKYNVKRGLKIGRAHV